MKKIPITTQNKNDIKVNNHLSITINLGDSLNLIALIACIFIIKKRRGKKKDTTPSS